MMAATIAMPGNTACTFLVHYFGGGLDGGDRFVVERFPRPGRRRTSPGPGRYREREGSAEEQAHRGLPQGSQGNAPGAHRGPHLHGEASQPQRQAGLGHHRSLDPCAPPPHGLQPGRDPGGWRIPTSRCSDAWAARSRSLWPPDEVRTGSQPLERSSSQMP